MAEETTKQPQSLQERLLEKSVKTMEKKIAEKTEQKLQAGGSPADILNQLLSSIGQNKTTPQDTLKQVTDLSEQQVPSGERMGVLTSLISGKGLSRPEKTEDLGLADAIKILTLQGQQQGRQQKVPQQQVDLMKSLLDLSGQLKQQQATGVEPERGPGGELTLKGIEEKKTAEVRASKSEDIRLKREVLRNDLDTYFEVAKLIPTGQGLKRIAVGTQNVAEGFKQDTPRGVAVERLNSLNKRLRVSLVRAAGDVGNLNIVEQKAAEELLLSSFDSTEGRQLKIAVLKDLSSAIDSTKEKNVKTIIRKWMNTTEFKKKFKEEGKPQQKQSVGKNEILTSSKKKFIIEQE